MRHLAFGVALLAMILPATGQAAPAPVRVSGDTGADGELLKDTLDLLTALAPIHNCDRIKTVETSLIPEDRIPRYASYRVDNPQAVYERWTVNYCGKFVRVMVIFVPDPRGGTYIAIKYPYPKDAL